MRNAADGDDKTIGEAVDERARVLEKTFDLSPETARVSAQDNLSRGMRNPGSDDVDVDRAAATRDSEERA